MTAKHYLGGEEMIWSSPPLRALTRPTPSLPRLHGARLTPPRTFMREATAKAVACYPEKERGAGPARKYQRNIKWPPPRLGRAAKPTGESKTNTSRPDKRREPPPWRSASSADAARLHNSA
jgi:hypothetical protein